MSERLVEFRGHKTRVVEYGNGCVFLEGPFMVDDRGTFMESFNFELFKRCGLPMTWHQDNLSWSRAGVFRGLHIQAKRPQGKLIRCLQGHIVDMAVDLRRDSPGYGKLSTCELDAPHQAFYVPAGFAHGFVAQEESLVAYKCTTVYDQKSDGGINGREYLKQAGYWAEKLIISAKDQRLPSVVDYRKLHG